MPRNSQAGDNQPPTERVIAPAPEAYVPPAPMMPRQMRMDRTNDQGVPSTRKFPDIRAGICEFCGVLDRNVPGQYQYRMCPHYRGLNVRCSYCPQSKNSEEIVAHSIIQVWEDPYHPGSAIYCCNATECEDAHNKRFSTVRR